MRICEVDNNLSIQSLAKWPNKDICKKHEETGNQAAKDKHVAKKQVKWKTLCFKTSKKPHCVVDLIRKMLQINSAVCSRSASKIVTRYTFINILPGVYVSRVAIKTIFPH